MYNLLDSTQNIKFWNTTIIPNFQVETEFETDRPMGDNRVKLKAIENKQTDNLTVQSQAFSMVASLRVNSGIVCYVIPDIINFCQSMINNTIESIKYHILQLNPLSADFSFKINDICNKYFNTLEFLSQNISKTYSLRVILIFSKLKNVHLVTEKKTRRGKL